MKNTKLLSAYGFLIMFLTFGIPISGQGTFKGDSILSFDFEGMLIGVAEYEQGPTGTTVFYFPEGVMGAADIRGGATGTVNAHVVTRGYERKMIEGVVFSGGSWYGLSAATGLANAIKDKKAEEGNVDFIAGVLGGIIYDVGGRRFSRVTPDEQLAREAFNSAKPNQFPLGARGAGRFAMQGSYFFANEKDSVDQYAQWPHSGQGAAFAQIGKTKVAVFTVVNAVGAIVDREGQLVRCHRNSQEGKCGSIADLIDDTELIQELRTKVGSGATENTTLTLVVTNLKLPYWALERLAKQVHTSMGRAIQPFATQYDGDVLYAVSTGAVEDPYMDPLSLNMVASELAWDAVLNSVPNVPELPILLNGKLDSEVLSPLEGSYSFYGGDELIISVSSGRLKAEFNGNGRLYFNRGTSYDLLPAENGLFIVDTAAKDVIRFNSNSEGIITGLTINPGPWHIEGIRK